MEEKKLLLRPEEVAHLLGFCRTKVVSMLKSGQVPGVVRVGRSIRANSNLIQEWAQTQGKTKVEGGEEATEANQ